MAEPSGNSDDPDAAPEGSPIDRWEELLESVTSDVSRIASDVSRIRQIVVAAWWLWWIGFTVCVLAYIIT